MYVYVCVCGGGGGDAEVLLIESYYEQMSFHSRFKEYKNRRISEIGWQRVTDGRRKKAEATLLEHFRACYVRFATLRSFSHNERRFPVGS